MDQAWKNINGYIVSFTSSFDQLKIQFYTEMSITLEKEYIPLLNLNCQRLPKWSSG